MTPDPMTIEIFQVFVPLILIAVLSAIFAMQFDFTKDDLAQLKKSIVRFLVRLGVLRYV